MKIYLLLLRFYFKLISAIAPKFAASQAFNLFQRPINGMIKPLEKSFFDRVERFRIAHRSEPIDCFELGDKDGKIVILIHGWESNAGSMSAIATSLADQGYRVVLFNLPAHGHSKLKKANLKTCSDTLDSVLRYYQYSGTPSIVSHSFGSAVATYTLAKKGYPVDKFIMLSTPDKIMDIFKNFKKVISLGNEAFNKMLQQVKEILGEDLDKVAINSLTQQIKYDELSIIHDEFDRVLPYENSRNVYENSPKATLTTLERVGHYKMLWNNSVIQSVSLTLGSSRKRAA